ncbi:MAG: 23S rRNA (guanosine(2251)-2'-O)-methyltransferase RlmB [Vicingaceae bacterium]|nr:MAG: 23S rRNA (guanosine(2251)-2'-O)-methyltransferase RlmB [Vicingaceae bacterium]
MDSFIIYGIHPVIEAIKAGKNIEKIYLQKGMRHEKLTELRKLIKRHKIPSQDVPETRLRLYAKNHQGIVALTTPIPLVDLENFIPQLFENGILPFVLILDRIQDVKNFGAICRSAFCFGVNLVVVPRKNSVAITPDAIKSSAGALNKLPMAKVNSMTQAIQYLKSSGFTIYAITEKGNIDLDNRLKPGFPCALILGNEHEGIHRDLLKLSDYKIKIPMKGDFDSLNVSAAAAIALYEFSKNVT